MMPDHPFSWHHLNEWSVAWLPLLLMALAAGAYMVGVGRANTWPVSRIVYFALGLLVTFLSTQSVVGVYDMELFSAHMIEHLGLIMVAAPLFALSAPLDLWRSADPDRAARVLDSGPAKVVLHPIFGFVLYAVFIPFSHLTGFFDLMLRYEVIHRLEQIGFLVVGYLFWRHAFGVEQGKELHPGLRFVYVMAAVPVDTITGLALAMSTSVPFPSYERLTTLSSSAILDNIHLGGAIMWIGGDALMLLWCIPVAVRWVKYETIKTKELDAVLDAAGI